MVNIGMVLKIKSILPHFLLNIKSFFNSEIIKLIFTFNGIFAKINASKKLKSGINISGRAI